MQGAVVASSKPRYRPLSAACFLKCKQLNLALLANHLSASAPQFRSFALSTTLNQHRTFFTSRTRSTHTRQCEMAKPKLISALIGL